MRKQLAIDFYRVVISDGSPPVEQLLRQVSQEPDDETRNVEVSGSPVRLQELHNWNDCLEGEMLRIRMDLLPRKASLDGDLEDLALDDDEGLGEETAFLYHPATRILVIQRNRTGVSASALAWYFKEKGHLGEPINLEPILQPDVIQRLGDVETVRKLEIKMAGLDHGSPFATEDLAVSEIVRLSQQLQAPAVTLTLSMGHRRGSLLVNAAVALARLLHRLSGDHPNEVQKIEVVGVNDAEEKVVLDLIEERLVESEVVTPSESRTIPYRIRRHALREAWGRQRDNLVGRFG